jgi:hypothetical protein
VQIADKLSLFLHSPSGSIQIKAKNIVICYWLLQAMPFLPCIAETEISRPSCFIASQRYSTGDADRNLCDQNSNENASINQNDSVFSTMLSLSQLPIKSAKIPGALSLATSWQLQLQGRLNTNYSVDLYDIDLFDTPATTIKQLKAAGKIVICYFSAGSFEDWRSDANWFSNEVKGRPLDDWPGERWLDIRASKVRQIISSRLDLAKKKGCDGVDPDNVDGYTNNTGFDLTAADQQSFNIYLARQAHSRGLLVGLKNAQQQIPALVEYFDFSVNEQCHEYNECESLMRFIKQGKPVFNVEYADKYVHNHDVRKALCNKARSLGMQTLILPLKLDNSFRISCRIPAQRKLSSQTAR